MSQPTSGPAQNYPFQQGPAPASYSGVAAWNTPAGPVGVAPGTRPTVLGRVSTVCGIAAWVVFALSTVLGILSFATSATSSFGTGGGDVAYTFSVVYFFSWFLQIPLTFLGFISGFIGIGAAYAPEQRRASKRGIFLNLSPWVVDTIIFLVTLILIASDF